MANNLTGENETYNRASTPYTSYSRSAGVSSYRRRRRQRRVFRVFFILVLAAILGGGAVVLGGRYIEKGGFSLISKQETEVSEQEEEAPVKLDPAQITLVAAGDVVMNSTVVQSGLLESGAYSFDHLFSHLSGELSGFDLRIVDQETNLPGSKFGFGMSTPLNAPQELGRAEIASGFNVILRATDHTLDNWYEGIHNELQWWKSEYPDVPLLGVAEPDPEQNPGLSDYVNNVYIYEKDGFKIAILNHTWGVNDESRGVVSALAEDKIVNDVNAARSAGVDLIVACPHWGVEYNTETSEEEIAFAWIYANCGVDVVIGSHPRVLQRTEVFTTESGHRMVCFYSLGCLISSLDGPSLVGGLAEITLSRDETGTCSVSSAVLKPVVTHRANGDAYGTYTLAEYSDDLAHESWDWSLGPEEINRQCAEILGEGYDAAAGEYRVAL